MTLGTSVWNLYPQIHVTKTKF